MGDDVYPVLVIRGYNSTCDICRARNDAANKKLKELFFVFEGVEIEPVPEEDSESLVTVLKLWMRIKLHDLKMWVRGRCT